VAGQRAGRIDAHALVGREAVLADGAGAHLHDPVHAARHATLPDELAVAGFGEPAVFRFDPDPIEALIVLGEREEAGARTDELEASGRRLGSPWGVALAARCRGLLAAADGDLDAALGHIGRAHERMPEPLERGRTLLHRGIILRRLKRKRDARQALQAIFEQIGTTLWAARAREELARISGAAPASGDGLTETERRIAALVRRRSVEQGGRGRALHRRPDRRVQPHPDLSGSSASARASSSRKPCRPEPHVVLPGFTVARSTACGPGAPYNAPPMAPPAPTARKIRVVVAKPGLDGHDRGAKIIARALRDAGMEVIYTGLHQTPEQIVETVIQEDADAVGLSILSGAHMTLVPRIVELLKEQGIDDVLLTVGGTIPGDDIPELKRLGVAEVFTPGAPTQDIIDFIQGAVAERERS
jgi:methylmalonyl-CoA mutase C-terminal domain/subunit